MNKTLLTIILFSLIMSAKGQNLKVIKLEKAKDFRCIHNGELFRIDSIISDQEKLCLSNSLKQLRIGIDDRLSIENNIYRIILLQAKKPPFTRGEDIDNKIKTTSKPEIPVSLGIYFDHVVATCTANNTTQLMYQSTNYDIVWLLPLVDKKRFYAERISPKKFLKQRDL